MISVLLQEELILSPSKSLSARQPFSLRFEHLFEDVARTSLPSISIADIRADGLDVGRGVGRRARTSAFAHNLIVGDVVPHIDHLLVGQVIFLEKLLIRFHLDRATEIDILHAEIFIPQPDIRCSPTREDHHSQSFFHGQLDGVSILDIDGTQRFRHGIHGDGLSAEHPIDIKDDRFDFFQIIIYLNTRIY